MRIRRHLPLVLVGLLWLVSWGTLAVGAVAMPDPLVVAVFVCGLLLSGTALIVAAYDPGAPLRPARTRLLPVVALWTIVPLSWAPPLLAAAGGQPMFNVGRGGVMMFSPVFLLAAITVGLLLGIYQSQRA